MTSTLTLRSGRQVIATTAPLGLRPGETGQQVGGTRVWLAFPHLPDEWYETTCRTIPEVSGWASVADDLDELLSVVGADEELDSIVAKLCSPRTIKEWARYLKASRLILGWTSEFGTPTRGARRRVEGRAPRRRRSR